MAFLCAHIYVVYSECMAFVNKRTVKISLPPSDAERGADRKWGPPRNGTFLSFLCRFVLVMQKDNFLEC
jgi:hypothetical protein